MDSKLFRKVLVISVIFLFFGITVQPITSVDIKQYSNSYQVEVLDQLNNINPKKYLYETIIQIANNPDIKELIKQNLGVLFSFDYSKDEFKELLNNNNPDFFDEVNNIITNNNVLSERILTLEAMNNDYPIICEILKNTFDLINPMILEILQRIVELLPQLYSIIGIIFWSIGLVEIALYLEIFNCY